MNLIILNYLEHFENDPTPPNAAYQIHSPENWNRALAVLRAFIGKDVSRVRSQPGVQPMFAVVEQGDMTTSPSQMGEHGEAAMDMSETTQAIGNDIMVSENSEDTTDLGLGSTQIA